MKKQALLFAFVMILGSVVAFSTGALAPNPLAAAPGGGQGPGGGGGGGEIPDYGDLFILYRDASGIPILTEDLCQQPIRADGTVIPVDPATCAVLPEYATETQEVDFGRINEVRSPASVFESQLEDATFKLATADAISLDPAGRLVACTATDGAATIDSPLQNLAIYKQLMTTGSLGVAIPGNPLETAARGLGVASDKSGEVTVDLVAYVNQMLGLTDLATTTQLGKTCIDVKEEVMGEVGLVTKCFLNYGVYGYARGTNFAGLPTAGTFEYLALVPGTESDPRFFIERSRTIMDAVFGDAGGNTGGNIGGFAQAADDTRAVIDFMHSNPVPSDYATAVTCEADPSITYDVSISDVSGLQVPVRMVAGTEGREFTVAVANGGPDPAAGTVTVTATDAVGSNIATFPRSYAFDGLPAGTSAQWTEGFGIDYKTTITWTATVVAEFDVNPNNNVVEETTTVTGGGGGGRP